MVAPFSNHTRMNQIGYFRLEGRISYDHLRCFSSALSDCVNRGRISPFVFEIDSLGGLALPSIGILRILQTCRFEVFSVCSGSALSMAAVILLCGQKGRRCVRKDSRIQLHRIHFRRLPSEIDTKDSLALVELQEYVLELLVARCMGRRELILDLISRGITFSGSEAKEMGLVDIVF